MSRRTYEWNYTDDLFAVCEVEYHPEDKGHGSCPDEPAYCELIDVKVGGQSIYALINDKQERRIEDLAFDWIESDLKDRRGEAQIAAYHDRMAA